MVKSASRSVGFTSSCWVSSETRSPNGGSSAPAPTGSAATSGISRSHSIATILHPCSVCIFKSSAPKGLERTWRIRSTLATMPPELQRVYGFTLILRHFPCQSSENSIAWNNRDLGTAQVGNRWSTMSDESFACAESGRRLKQNCQQLDRRWPKGQLRSSNKETVLFNRSRKNAAAPPRTGGGSDYPTADFEQY